MKAIIAAATIALAGTAAAQSFSAQTLNASRGRMADYYAQKAIRDQLAAQQREIRRLAWEAQQRDRQELLRSINYRQGR